MPIPHTHARQPHAQAAATPAAGGTPRPCLLVKLRHLPQYDLCIDATQWQNSNVDFNEEVW